MPQIPQLPSPLKRTKPGVATLEDDPAPVAPQVRVFPGANLPN